MRRARSLRLLKESISSSCSRDSKRNSKVLNSISNHQFNSSALIFHPEEESHQWLRELLTMAGSPSFKILIIWNRAQHQKDLYQSEITISTHKNSSRTTFRSPWLPEISRNWTHCTLRAEMVFRELVTK